MADTNTSVWPGSWHKI